MPVRAVAALLALLLRRRISTKAKFDIVRSSLAVSVSLIMWMYSDSSFIYHWIRGQSFVKLYVLFNLLEIMDFLFRSLGKKLIANLSFDIRTNAHRNLLSNSLFCFAYLLAHSCVLLVQMFTLNGVAKSSVETLLLFVLSNNFAELKITVFKKADMFMFYDFVCNDAAERVQIGTYVFFVLINNSLNEQLAFSLAVICGSELLMDWMKHFFLVERNAFDPLVFRHLKQLVHRLGERTTRRGAVPQKNHVIERTKAERQVLELEGKVFQIAEESCMPETMQGCCVVACLANFLSLPHLCLIIRNLMDYLFKYYF